MRRGERKRSLNERKLDKRGRKREHVRGGRENEKR